MQILLTLMEATHRKEVLGRQLHQSQTEEKGNSTAHINTTHSSILHLMHIHAQLHHEEIGLTGCARFAGW